MNNDSNAPTIPAVEEEKEAAVKLLYQGHGSFRITSKEGVVIYVDPYAGEGYDVPADIVLITHQHGDHNKDELVAKKPDCVLISNKEALKGGSHRSFTIGNIAIEAVEASNTNHDPKECVGYIININGIKIYAAGDTSKTKDMETFPGKSIDYALLPCDGIYNMDAEEAAECAVLIGARFNIPIHTDPGSLFNLKIAETFIAPNRLIIEAGEEMEL